MAMHISLQLSELLQYCHPLALQRSFNIQIGRVMGHLFTDGPRGIILSTRQSAVA